MTGKGRCIDNIYIERFWRSFKREEFYLNEYLSVKELRKQLVLIWNFITSDDGINRWDIKHLLKYILSRKEKLVGMGGVIRLNHIPTSVVTFY